MYSQDLIIILEIDGFVSKHATFDLHSSSSSSTEYHGLRKFLLTAAHFSNICGVGGEVGGNKTSKSRGTMQL